MNTYKSLVEYCNKRNITLVAVSKTRPKSAIEELYKQGQRVFGENRVQELVTKEAILPKDISWHLIGHLQTNKIKAIAPFISMIHSCDRSSLLNGINKEANKLQRKIDVLLQIKIAQEESKNGWDYNELIDQLEHNMITKYEALNFRGVMGMATFTDNKNIVNQEFLSLKTNFDDIKSKYFNNSMSFDRISMGMSGDYKVAANAGSNMIRVGSLLFGKRN